MGKADNIPSPAVRRLSFYLRQLEVFFASGRRTVSSKQLGNALRLSDAQVRKDLAYFGQFGRSGIGYRVPELIARVREILGTDTVSNVLLVGAGNLGRALMLFRGFAQRGFEIVAVFDNDPSKIGTPIEGNRAVPIRSLDDMPIVLRDQPIRLGIIAVPAGAAQSVADQMVAAGIRGILNFAPLPLHAPPSIAVSSVDLAVHLEQLSFQTQGATLP